MPGDGYYRHPTIWGDTVAFVSEDDLWTVGTEGGLARRLTANPGSITFPAFSPDGSLIAFTSRDEGHPEAYVMEAAGGPAERLTFMGAFTYVVGWAPDGNSVIVTTDWRQPFSVDLRLWAVPVDGGPPTQIVPGPARTITFAPEGEGRAISRGAADPARWKRYRGGTAGTIWVDRAGDGKFRHLVRMESNLAVPMWVGSRIFFISDHEGVGNLYSVTSTGRSLRRHTDLDDFYARFPSSDGRQIAFHAGADLWVHDVVTDESRRLDVRTSGSRPHRNRRYVKADKHFEAYHLHPEGHSVAITARGGAFSMPLWEGAPLRHGEVSSSRYRLTRWLPDGKRLVAVTDETGHESLVIWNADGRGRPKKVATEFGRAVSMLPAPAGEDRVAITNHRYEVVVVDLANAKTTAVERSRFERIQGAAWSPDGRWLAYGLFDGEIRASIRLHDTKTGKTVPVTDGEFLDRFPSFDPEGRYLYFISARTFDPVEDTFYFDRGFPRGMKPYLVTLQADATSPFDPSGREPRPPGPSGGDDSQKDDEADTELKIDIAGIGNRVVEFPVPEGRYRSIAGAKGRVLFSSFPIGGMMGESFPATPNLPQGKLEAYDFSQEKVEPVAEGISSFSVTADGQTAAIRSANKLRIVPSSFKEGNGEKKDDPGRESGWLDLDRLRVEVKPEDEWRQMVREAWRLQREQFWTEDMAGVDWDGVYERYAPLVERVGTRAELSDFFWEMQAELGTSHAYETLGDYRPEPAWHQGFLGADVDWDGDARAWVVVHIPAGDAWKHDVSSPLTRPGVGVVEGDHIVAVDGVPANRTRGPDSLLVDRAGTTVNLTVRRGRRRRTVPVTTLKSEELLRYRSWVERNRSLVLERTEGSVGYLHIPDMGSRGYAEFHRYFRTEVERPGLIVDVRNNRGGNVSQLLLEKLRRHRIGYNVSRWSEPASYPEAAPMGPMVAITDEYSGSDGDIFSHSFKLFGLGPLIGKRTWGGVVGISPRHRLVDGTVTTQPEFAFWFEDVGWKVENYGTEPDIEVDNRPQDYAQGFDAQLERGLSEITKLLKRMKPEVPPFEPPPRRAPISLLDD